VDRWILLIDVNGGFKVGLSLFKLVKMEVGQTTIIIMNTAWLQLDCFPIELKCIIKLSSLKVRQTQVIMS
jgi:hypothetical protein